MSFPDKKTFKKIRDLAEDLDPDFVLGDNPTSTDKIKYQLCQIFVAYIQDHEVTQTELSESLGIPQPRLNEVLKCKIHLFTIDRLIEYHSKLFPDATLELKKVS